MLDVVGKLDGGVQQGLEVVRQHAFIRPGQAAVEFQLGGFGGGEPAAVVAVDFTLNSGRLASILYCSSSVSSAFMPAQKAAAPLNTNRPPRVAPAIIRRRLATQAFF
jgi:hypothetical protein